MYAIFGYPAVCNYPKTNDIENNNSDITVEKNAKLDFDAILEKGKFASKFYKKYNNE